MTDTFRALCAELVDIITAHANPDDYAVGDIAEMLARARAALAKADEPAVPAPPADGEVAERAAELLQRQVLVPVSVSERLPGPEDCNAEGKCWLCGKVEGDWRLINPEKSGVPHLKYCFTHWLPAHALPLPEVNNG